jgi:hypothetical protein
MKVNMAAEQLRDVHSPLLRVQGCQEHDDGVFYHFGGEHPDPENLSGSTANFLQVREPQVGAAQPFSRNEDLRLRSR